MGLTAWGDSSRPLLPPSTLLSQPSFGSPRHSSGSFTHDTRHSRCLAKNVKQGAVALPALAILLEVCPVQSFSHSARLFCLPIHSARELNVQGIHVLTCRQRLQRPSRAIGRLCSCLLELRQRMRPTSSSTSPSIHTATPYIEAMPSVAQTRARDDKHHKPSV